MLTIEHVFRRSAVTLGLLVATAGGAAAQDAPAGGTDGSDDAEAQAPTTQPPAAPPSTTVNVDVNPPPPQPPPPMYAPYPIGDEEDRRDSTLERYGIGVALSGGVEGFTNETLRDATNDGGGWGVRVIVGTRSPVGLEASYIGSAQEIEALGLDTDALLVSNGVQGNLRVNLTDANIQPFAFAGVAYRHYELAQEDFNTSDIQSADDVWELPLGAGIAWKYRGLIIDARGEYRLATDEDLMPDLDAAGRLTDEDGEMHRWGVNLNAGYAF